jgi:DNA polymerase-3 subunit beta
MQMVATDGRRLACAKRTLQESSGFEKIVILPKKTVLELSKSLKDEGEIKIIFGDNQMLFAFDDLIALSRLIEGEFPNYKQVIPNESKEKIKVNRDQGDF